MIIYAGIGRSSDGAVLVDCCDPLLKGNAGFVTTLLLQHLRDHPEVLTEGERQTFIQKNQDTNPDIFSSFIDACSMVMGEDLMDEHFFHLLYKEGVIYLCIGDDESLRDQRVNFAFLDNIHAEFTRLHRPGKIQSANAYSFEKTFRPNMRTALHHYNTNHESIAQQDEVKVLMAQVHQLTQVMGRNINLLLERGEQFEALVAKSDDLREDALVFKKNSRKVTKQQKRKYYKGIVVQVVIVIGILVVVTTIIALTFCGFGLEHCRSSEGGNQNGNRGN